MKPGTKAALGRLEDDLLAGLFVGILVVGVILYLGACAEVSGLR